MKKGKDRKPTIEVHFDKDKQAEYLESFKKENKDPEILELAEDGLGDFVEMIERYEGKTIK